jgi:hypothetical protein
MGLAIVVAIGVLLAAIHATLDAAALPDTGFESVGAHRSTWIVLPLLGQAFGPVGLIATIWRFARTKPRVLAAMTGDSDTAPTVG